MSTATELPNLEQLIDQRVDAILASRLEAKLAEIK